MIEVDRARILERQGREIAIVPILLDQSGFAGEDVVKLLGEP